MSIPHIEISRAKPVNTGGALRAFVDLRIGPMEIREARYIRQEGKVGFVCGPQSEWTDRQGAKKYTPLVLWPKDWNESILHAVEEALQDHPDGIQQIQTPSRQPTFRGEYRSRAGLSDRGQA